MKRVLLLLLVASHLAVFVLARRQVGSDRAMDHDAKPAAAITMAPAKAGERGEGEAYSHQRCLEDLLKSDLSRADFVVARRELFRDWIRRDLIGALAELLAPGAWGRYWRLARELEDEVKDQMTQQPRETWAWIIERRDNDVAYHWWLDAMRSEGEAGLLLELLPEASAKARQQFLFTACKRATKVELGKIRDLLEERIVPAKEEDPGTQWTNPLFELENDQRWLVENYAERLVELHGDDMAGLLAAEKDPVIRFAILREWYGMKMAGHAADIAVAELLRLPEEYRKQALQSTMSTSWGRNPGYSGAAGLINELDRRGVLQVFTEQERSEWVQSTVDGLREDYTSLERAVRESSTIGREELRHEVLKYVGVGFSTVDSLPAEAAKLPPGPDRDALVAGALDDMSPDWDEYPMLVPLLDDPVVKKKFADLLEEELKGEEEE